MNGGTLTLNMALSLGNQTLNVNSGQLVTDLSGGGNAAVLAANGANNASDGLPGNITQAGWLKLTATIANNLTSMFIPYWQTDPS